jgi:hypothetical protein
MGKFFLTAFMLTGAALFNPAIRGQVAPHVQFAFDPIYKWSTNGRIGEITRIIEAQAAQGRRVPQTQEELARLIAQEFSWRDSALDSWGTPFYVKRERFAVRVVSAGPDREPGTADDLAGKPIAVTPRN